MTTATAQDSQTSMDAQQLTPVLVLGSHAQTTAAAEAVTALLCPLWTAVQAKRTAKDPTTLQLDAFHLITVRIHAPVRDILLWTAVQAEGAAQDLTTL